jgi:peptidoglycan/LPS O-acetylase OafA/YrhL
LPRIWFLDLLRAAAISGVLLFHCLPADGIPGALNRLREAAWCGVDLFFVLSGFLITTILLAARAGEHPFRTFFVRRTLRIFPLYFAWLGLVFGLNALVERDSITALQPQLPYFATYTSNVWIADHLGWFPSDRLNHLWSLAIEEQFYLLWPFVVLLLNRRLLTIFALAGIAYAVVLKASLLFYNVPWPVPYTWSPTRMDALLGGALVAMARFWHPDSAWLRPLGLLAAVFGAAVVIGVFAFQGSLSLAPPFGLTSVTVATAGLAFVFSGILAAMPDGRWEASVPAILRRAVSFVARISYGLYLSHWIVLGAFRDWYPGLSTQAPSLQFAVIVTVSVAVSMLLYAAVEKPSLRLAERLAPARRESAAARLK